MLSYLGQIIALTVWPTKKHIIVVPLAMLWLSFLISGCRASRSEDSFDEFGSSGGISLERPNNWQAEFDDRNDTLTLKAEKGISGQDSTQIIIQPYTRLPNTSPLLEQLQSATDITGVRYNLDTITVIQEPATLENEVYEIATAKLLIPAEPLPSDPTAMQSSTREPYEYRELELRVIRCTNNFAMVYIYKGNSEQLNVEAVEIVDSIDLNCSAKP